MENIKSNDYLGLLSGDSVKIKHPLDQGKVITLYRVIALKTFRIKKFAITIKEYDTGGWAESIENFTNTPCWIKDSARIFDNAVISNDSIVSDTSLIFGNSVIDGSRVENYSRVYGDALINDSLLKDFSEVKDNSKIISSKLFNGVRVDKNATVKNSTMKDGAYCTENAYLDKCELIDASIARGSAELFNCEMINHAIIKEGDYRNKKMNRTHDLSVRRVQPEDDPYPSETYGKGSQIIQRGSSGGFNAQSAFNSLKN